jgi:hypothetical protein
MAMTEEFPTRSEMKLLYTLQPGEDYRYYAGRIIVVHPDRPPKIINSDGTTHDIVVGQERIVMRQHSDIQWIERAVLDALRDREPRWAKEINENGRPLAYVLGSKDQFWYALGALIKSGCVCRGAHGFRITGCGLIAAALPR